MTIFIIILVAAVILFGIYKLCSNNKDQTVTTETIEEPQPKEEKQQKESITEDAVSDDPDVAPYLRSKKTIFAVCNEQLLNEEKELIDKIFDFVQEESQKEDFENEVKTIIPTCEIEPYIPFLFGDITTCIQRIGGNPDVCTPHGIVFVLAINKMQNREELSSSLNIMCINDEMMEMYRNISAGFSGACKAISGQKTFIISSILNNIDSPQYGEYIELMIQLTKTLMKVQNDSPTKAEQFIKHLHALKKDILAE